MNLIDFLLSRWYYQYFWSWTNSNWKNVCIVSMFNPLMPKCTELLLSLQPCIFPWKSRKQVLFNKLLCRVNSFQDMADCLLRLLITKNWPYFGLASKSILLFDLSWIESRLKNPLRYHWQQKALGEALWACGLIPKWAGPTRIVLFSQTAGNKVRTLRPGMTKKDFLPKMHALLFVTHVQKRKETQKRKKCNKKSKKRVLR